VGDWGLGFGDWGLGIGPNPQSPIPNPQSPIPNLFKYKICLYKINLIFKIIINLLISSLAKEKKYHSHIQFL